ncbi:TldD/PmbA family protein [Dactylosporangium sp. CA-139066]
MKLADAALGRAAGLGAGHAAVRVARTRRGGLLLHDGGLRAAEDVTDSGLAVRVRHGGAWGFAAVPELTPEAAADAAARAVELARSTAGLFGPPVEPAGEPVHRDRTWVSPHRTAPFDVPEPQRVALLADWAARLLAAPGVAHAVTKVRMADERTFYADLAGSSITQRRVRVHPMAVVMAAGGRTQRSLGPPVARGWEYLLGEGWDWDRELAGLPGLLAGKVAAEPVRPGRYDLVMAPSHLWLTIHESVGHATELDRALGHEVSYAGGTFATPEQLGRLRYGSPLMHVTADRTTAHELATAGYDDEGVAAQRWDLVRGGVLCGYQTDRATAGAAGQDRSTGCAYAESARHLPIARLANVSLQPDPAGPATDALIAGVADGIYLAGSDSFSIDAQRRQFQFSAQTCYRIRNGRLEGQLGGVAYQAETVAFWNALAAIGGPASYGSFGADLCGKGQPVQAAAASHGAPAAVFEGITVVNTGEDA